MSRCVRSCVQQGHRTSRLAAIPQVIPHLYEQHGPTLRRTSQRHVRNRGVGRACAAGARSFAIGSASSRSTTPWSANLLVFGSELKAVLASGLVDLDLDFEAIDAYLTLGFFPGVMTPFRGVAKVPPGGMIVVDNGAARVETVVALSRARVLTGAPSLSARMPSTLLELPRGQRPAQAAERRPPRGDAQRRSGLEPDRRPHGSPLVGAREDVLGRFRGGRGVERARRRTIRLVVVRNRPSRAGALVCRLCGGSGRPGVAPRRAAR